MNYSNKPAEQKVLNWRFKVLVSMT